MSDFRLSDKNHALLTRKLGKSPPSDDATIKLRLSALASLLDAARQEGVAAQPKAKLSPTDAAIEQLLGKIRR